MSAVSREARVGRLSERFLDGPGDRTAQKTVVREDVVALRGRIVGSSLVTERREIPREMALRAGSGYAQ